MARGYSGQGNPYGALYMLGSLLSAGLCIAILVIVNQYLWYGAYCYYVSGFYTCYSHNRCYMQTSSSQSDANMCYYSWAAAGVGLFFAFCVFFMQVCSGRNRHIPACEVLICIIAVLWWIAAATTGTVYGHNADDVPVQPGNSSAAVDSQVLDEKTGYRTSVWAMGWANMSLWFIMALISLKDCVSMRKQAPPAAAYPTGAYAAPAYQQPNVYGAPPPGGAPPAYYGAPPPGGYPAAGYPPASPFAGGAPAGYPPAGYPPAQPA
ncbi:hypothetical protein ABPG75_008460 [Micractinium tetrahymenae]